MVGETKTIFWVSIQGDAAGDAAKIEQHFHHAH